jgi:hypothetical protein
MSAVMRLLAPSMVLTRGCSRAGRRTRTRHAAPPLKQLAYLYWKNMPRKNPTPQPQQPAPASGLSYNPVWDGVFEKYTHSYIARNLWKLQRTCTHEDAMQEARIVWLDCVRRYASKTDNASWFMALYKRALASRVIDLAALDSKHKAFQLLCDLSSDDDDGGPQFEAAGELENEGYLRCVVDDAPAEVKEVLVLLLNAPAEIAEAVGNAWSGRGKSRAAGSKVLCRMLGLQERSTLLDEVQAYLAPGV